MTEAQIIEYCLSLPGAIKDYPFEDRQKAIMRHGSGGKWFALLLTLNGELCINLKCDPMRADLLRRVYDAVAPAWHMSKVHWNTVKINGDVPKEELMAMISESYRLTNSAAGKNQSRHSNYKKQSSHE